MSFISKLRWFFRQRWGYYLATVLLMCATSFLNTIPPRMIGDVIDQIRIGSLTGESLMKTIALLIGLAVSMYLMIYIWNNTLFGSSVLLEKELRNRLFRHLTWMPPSFYHRNRTGDLMALATNDILAISNTAGFGVLTLVNTVVGTTIVVVSMVAFISFKLMVAALLPLPLLALAINKLGKAMRHRFMIAQQSFGRMNDHVLESISGLRVLRSYVQEEKDIEAFDRVTKDVMEKNIGVAYINALFQPAISTIVGLSFSIGIGYGSYLVFHSEITLGELVTFNIYLGLLIWPMIAFGEFINILQRGSASVDRLDQNLRQTSDVADAVQPVPVAVPTSIEMDRFTFRYPGTNIDVLKGVSFRLERGETLGIVGRTGSGKSTLLKQLLRQYPLEPGRLKISGQPIEQIAIDQVRSWIGYVPQEHMLLSKTIRENIALGKPDASAEELERVIKLAALETDISQMKDGLETVIGEHGVMLSGGQKQRIAIARALLANPEILILDDSLSAVDARTENAILKNIREYREGRTTLIATHRLSAVSHAHWILVLDDGAVLEEGTHEQLLQKGGWYKQQYERQQLEESLLGDEQGDV